MEDFDWLRIAGIALIVGHALSILPIFVWPASLISILALVAFVALRREHPLFLWGGIAYGLYAASFLVLPLVALVLPAPVALASYYAISILPAVASVTGMTLVGVAAYKQSYGHPSGAVAVVAGPTAALFQAALYASLLLSDGAAGSALMPLHLHHVILGIVLGASLLFLAQSWDVVLPSDGEQHPAPAQDA